MSVEKCEINSGIWKYFEFRNSIFPKFQSFELPTFPNCDLGYSLISDAMVTQWLGTHIWRFGSSGLSLAVS